MPRASVRDKVLDSALLEFHRRGFHGCSVQDITDSAGVPKGSFYNHFASKDEIAAAAVRLYVQRTTDEVDPGRPALPQLRARYEGRAERLRERGYERGCLVGNMATELSDHVPTVRVEVDAALAGWTDTTARLLQQAQREGTLAADRDTEQLARMIIDAWEGAVLRAKVTKTDRSITDFFALVFNELLRF